MKIHGSILLKKNYSFSILINSTSNASSEPGPIDGLGELSPYAKSEGTYNFHLLPTDINYKASCHPLITPLTGNTTGSPRSTELSKMLPSNKVPW